VIGWIGFVITSFDVKGNNGILHGYFTRMVGKASKGRRATPPTTSAFVQSSSSNEPRLEEEEHKT
jgi:hypothetical protein